MTLSGNIKLLVSLFLVSSLVGCPSDPEDKPSIVDVFEPSQFGTFTYERVPDIDAQSPVDFGELDQGERGTQTIEIFNLGNDVLKIASFETTEGFSVELFEDRLPEISPNTAIPLRVTYFASDESLRRGTLTIASNDPDEPNFEIELIANQRFPCLEVSPNPLDFGVIDPDGFEVDEVEVTNCSTRSRTTFTMGELVATVGPLAFNQTTRQVYQNVALEVGESVVIPFAFTPQGTGRYEARTVFRSDDQTNPEIELVLQGRGRDLFAPQPVIDALNTERGDTATADPTGTYNGLPLDTIEFSAARSRDPEGQALTFSWALISRPMDSAAMLVRNEGVTSGMWLDLAGTYIVELTAVSDDGRVSTPATMTLYATADQDMHIQLVWDTPNDPFQQDSSGSDVDIHLLRDGGQWNQAPWDCFWQNMEPDWGVTRGVAADGSPIGYNDDPSLDIDDVDGWGPENINFDNPQNGRVYDIGVQYFDAHGYGASFVTVRIYLGGVLAYEKLRQRMTDQQFWHVADIAWPSRNITPINTVTDSTP